MRPPKRPGVPQGGVGRLCFLIAKDLRTALDRDLAQFDLRAQQAAVLLLCCRRPAKHPSHLAAAVGTDTAGISGLIDQLERTGLVIRRAHRADRRAVLVEPTKAGRALAPRIRQVFQALGRRLLAGFTEKEGADLAAMLRRVRDNVGGHLAERTAAAPVAEGGAQIGKGTGQL
jgi:DNA-binding MarR family transcriptional regulator